MLGTLLREFRKEKRVPIDEVAAACGVSEVAIFTYESGTRMPQAKTIIKLANVYGVPVSCLMDALEYDEEKKQA